MDVQIKFKGGGSITSCPPVFSDDEQFLYVPWKNVVLCYYTKTAKRAHELKGLKNNVVGFSVVNLNGKECIFACSVTGEIISWSVDHSHATIKSKIPLKDITVKKFHTILWKINEEEHKQVHLLSWTSPKSEASTLSLGLFDISDGKLREVKLTLENGEHDIATGGSENPFFAVVQGRKLYFAKLKEGKHIYKRKIHGRSFTCVACHPLEECVLTGDSSGRILIWNNLTSSPTQTIFHWHTLPVRTLCFSHSGNYFFSGAGESVLVKWNVEDSNKRQFLPRLSSTIEQITVSKENVMVAVTTGDNVVEVLDFRLERISTIQHLVLGRNYPAGIQYDPRTGALVMNGIVGHVQFYSPKDMSLLYNLDIVGQNKLSRERECEINNTDVVRLAIDKQGKWLASVEERSDSDSYEMRLKFWLFDFVGQKYMLNTSIELPHENTIHSLNFQPTPDSKTVRCVTVGGDKKFKIWEVVDADSIYKKGSKWVCTAVGFYKDFPCKCLDFSSDGSILGISFDFTVTIWESDTCNFKYSLSYPQTTNEITHVKFGAQTRSHLLVSTTAKHVILWNLLTLNAIWVVNIEISLLVGNYFSVYVALFTKDNRVIVVDPGNPTPVYMSDELKSKNSKVLTAAFVPRSTIVDSNKNEWYNNCQLYYIDSNQELYCFEKGTDNEVYPEIMEAENKSLFSATIPKLKSGHYQKEEAEEYTVNKYSDIKKIREFLQVPANTMAPIRLTCGTVIKLLLEYKEKREENV